MIRGLRVAAAAGGLALAFAAPTAAQRTLTLESFDAEITVGQDAVMEVVERLRFRFDGSWNGVFRFIPVEMEDSRGLRTRLLLDLATVETASGEELRTELSREGRNRKVKIWIPDARDRTETVVIRYRVRNGIRFFDEHDELYWNVTGNEWEVPIESARARVRLPEGASGRRVAAYTGPWGARANNAEIEETETGFLFTSGRLEFGEGMTVVVGWDPGVVARPSPARKAYEFLLFNWPLFVPLLSLAFMWRLWQAKGRDPDARPITPVYEPPEGFTPATAGTLVDNRVDMRDITATLVDLAVRGYLRIEEEDQNAFERLFASKDYRFVQLRNDATGLAPHERQLLVALFEDDSEITTEDLENRFYKKLPGIRDAVFDRLVDEGHYAERPDSVLQKYVGLGVLVSVVATGAFIAATAAVGATPLPGIIGGILTGLPVLAFGFFMPARTVRGARKMEEIRGFEEFLSRVESDRFKRMIKGPEQFEAFLPFAMAFAVDKEWARAFESMYREAATRASNWYVSRSGSSFSPSDLTSNLRSVSTRTSSAMASAPRSSSSSSGFGGGGFSGGGGGGGGGGGF